MMMTNILLGIEDLSHPKNPPIPQNLSVDEKYNADTMR